MNRELAETEQLTEPRASSGDVPGAEGRNHRVSTIDRDELRRWAEMPLCEVSYRMAAKVPDLLRELEEADEAAANGAMLAVSLGDQLAAKDRRITELSEVVDAARAFFGNRVSVRPHPRRPRQDHPMTNRGTEMSEKREGKRIECMNCWAHPRTARLCYCDEPRQPAPRTEGQCDPRGDHRE